MSKKIFDCFYSHFKNSPKKLKIVCDWDEVIQCLEPFALYKALKKTKSVPRGLEKLAQVANQSDFPKKVYELCSQIPKGQVSTYKLIALEVYGRASAARTVGTILRKCECKEKDISNYQCK